MAKDVTLHTILPVVGHASKMRSILSKSDNAGSDCIERIVLNPLL